LPGLIDLYEAHKKDRDKFEILAFHDGTVKDFADLDKKMESPKQKYWNGRDLPFPILLDATGQTIKDWGVHGFPTTLLIDPEGKLVGEAGEDALTEKLPPLPMSVRVAKALDRSLSFGIEEIKLEEACKFLSRQSRVPIRLDAEDVKAAGVRPDSLVPLTLAGSLSLRSWLNLLLEADGLTYEQDDKGIVIRRRKPGAPPELSPVQRACVGRIEKVLDQKISFDFKDKPLSEVARFFENKTQENFVFSPRDRKAGTLDPKMPVTGSAKDLPLREALTKLLGPLGVGYTIRDEVIVLTAKPKAVSK
jgi:hypothetical protein